MDSPLAELSQRLLARADASLLDLRLDALCERIADSEVRELLQSVHESGHSDRLRDLLDGGRLAGWASESCTAREEEALCGQLRKWLGAGGQSGDDPARLVSIPEVPEAVEALLSWAAEYHLERVLVRPAQEVLPAQVTVPAGASLLDVCLGTAAVSGRGASLLAQQRAQTEARAYLRGLAAEASALTVRSALHRSPLPEGTLGVLARRLRALMTGRELVDLHGTRFLPARPVSVDVETGIARGALCAPADEPPIQVTAYLSGFEQRALEVNCSCCEDARCVHTAALAARLLDACLSSDDRLHAPLARFASVPSWRRFMDALSAPGHRHGGAPETLLSFGVRLTGERVLVGTLLSRREDGRVNQGKLVSPAKMARSQVASDRDQAVLAALSPKARTLVPQYVAADAHVLRSLVEHPHVVLSELGSPLRVREETLHVALVEQPEGLIVEVSLAGHVLKAAPQSQDDYVSRCDPQHGELLFAALTPPLRRLLQAQEHFRGVLPPESYPQLATWISGIRPSARVSTPKVLEGRELAAPKRLLLRITPMPEEGIDLSLTVRALPLAPLWSPGQGPELVHGLMEGAPASVRRDLLHERSLAAEVVTELALDQAMGLGTHQYRVDTTQAALELLSKASRLTEQLEIEWAERARPLRIAGSASASDLKVSLFKRGEWCALEGGVQVGNARVAVDRLLSAARTGERFVPVGGDDYVEIERALFELLGAAELSLTHLARELLLPRAALPLWLDKLEAQTRAGDAETSDLLTRVRAANDLSVPAQHAFSPNLHATLREYQRQGAAWLLQRSTWAQGACLADEMGLGKTLQTIAVLVERRTRGPALVLAPTSVVSGWCDELARFAPELRVIPYRGAARETALAQLAEGSVLVASYDVLLRDRDHFENLHFATLVVDEAQVLKNARTLRARAVTSLAADFRIALSGTPVENRLGDLWSLFQIVAPGLLGTWSRFRARFAVPIERYENQERAAALRGLVAPFMLRRTKAEVAQELPPRTEVVHVVELSRAEQDLYATALSHARTALGKRRRSDDGTRAVQILAELTRLRQLACHPRLVLGDSRVGSSKLRALEVLLSDLLPRGHRVLIFSQFVSHLALIREALEMRGISHCSLEGSTPAGERAKQVQRFQRGECAVFLISLKAGGTGLNLTAADYVVHMDPWWNPSAEDQASDRAHRIGQDKPVTVVKLVAQSTIEERVLGLHEHKRRLASLVLSEGAAGEELDLATLEALIQE